jgi:hypothetical protein
MFHIIILDHLFHCRPAAIRLEIRVLTASVFYDYIPITLSRPRGAFMRRHLCGERFGACCSGSSTGTPGRPGAPPPVTTNRREELADGEAKASRKARPGPRNRRAGALRSARLSRREANGRPMRRAALRPPRISYSRADDDPAKTSRGNDGAWPKAITTRCFSLHARPGFFPATKWRREPGDCRQLRNRTRSKSNRSPRPK